jgi:hypothetical protein
MIVGGQLLFDPHPQKSWHRYCSIIGAGKHARRSFAMQIEREDDKMTL